MTLAYQDALTELSLFSGYCGFTLGLRLAGLQIRTVGYVDNEPFIQKLIARRIKDGFLDAAPVFGDVRAFINEGYAGSYCGVVDVLTAGFPCQPHSSAGRRLGAGDPRNLWPELAECIGAVRPRYVLLENVPGLIDGAEPYVAVVLGDLARIGYDARWGLVPAAVVGAPHLRWRWWCLAYPSSPAVPLQQGGKRQQESDRMEPERAGKAVVNWDGGDGAVADAASDGRGTRWPKPARKQGRPRVAIGSMGNALGTGLAERQGQPGDDGWKQPPAERASWWGAEPALDRVVDGYPSRVDELRAIGNGIVPLVVVEFLRRIGAGVRQA